VAAARAGTRVTEREALVDRYLPLARRLARRFSGGAEPLEDLEQVAAIGLLKAIDRYDASRGTAFTSYAVPTITGEIKRHFRDHGWRVHLSRTLQERILKMRRVEETLLEDLGHSPTTAELAERLDWTTEALLEVRAAASASRPTSLDELQHTAEGEQRLADCLGASDPELVAADDLLLIRDCLKRLPQRDRMILVLRLQNDLTQEEIASRFGLSQMHISRILRRSLERLRALADDAI
jgi:RNA polymerase sigma-B factor